MSWSLYGCESIVWAVVHGFVCHYLVLLVEVEWITAGIEQVLSHNLITHFLTCGKIRNKILIRGKINKPTRFHYCNERQITINTNDCIEISYVYDYGNFSFTKSNCIFSCRKINFCHKILVEKLMKMITCHKWNHMNYA